MAVSCSFSSPQIQLEKSCLISSPISRTFMLKSKQYSQVPLCKNKFSLLQVRSFKKKVFENKSEGIICYRDEISGEIICEGFDEGPRLLHQPLRPTYNSRDSEIVNLLHQRLLQVVNGGQLNNTGNGVGAVQED